MTAPYGRQLNPPLSDNCILPASLLPPLNHDFLPLFDNSVLPVLFVHTPSLPSSPRKCFPLDILFNLPSPHLNSTQPQLWNVSDNHVHVVASSTFVSADFPHKTHPQPTFFHSFQSQMAIQLKTKKLSYGLHPLIFNPLYTANHPNIFDIIETWLTSTNSYNEMIPLRYQIHHRDRVSLGGGIMIAVSDSPTPSSYPLMLILLQI